MTKKYLLFAYNQYYPCGGMQDLRGEYDTIEEAEIYVKEDGQYIDGWEIVEHKTMKIVKSG